MIYGHGDDLYAYPQGIRANFSSNVWHLGTHPQLQAALQNAITTIDHYPDPNGDTIRQALARKYNLTPEHFTVTNGAAEALYNITQAWRQTAATIFVPAFSEYEDAATLNNITLTFLPEETLSHTDTTLTTPLAFLCNPNNPTGRSTPAETLVKLIADNPDTVFVVDEAYTDFTEISQSLLPHLNALPNVILVRAYTKTYAIPGLRIGYTISQPQLTARILKFKIPWSVNSLALEACRYILQHESTLRPNMSALLTETRWLQQQINALAPFEAQPSATPFFLAKLNKGNSTELKQYLATEWQCLVRDAANFRALGNTYIRIATQTREKNELLLNGLRAWTRHT